MLSNIQYGGMMNMRIRFVNLNFADLGYERE